jgi:hypothetical protein
MLTARKGKNMIKENKGREEGMSLMISKDQERIGQYATKTRAIRACKMERMRTGRAHGHILTTCYRDLQPRVCWAIYLDMGFGDAMNRVLGA